MISFRPMEQGGSRHLSTLWTIDGQTSVLPCLYVCACECGLKDGRNSEESMQPCRCGLVVMETRGERVEYEK